MIKSCLVRDSSDAWRVKEGIFLLEAIIALPSQLYSPVGFVYIYIYVD